MLQIFSGDRLVVGEVKLSPDRKGEHVPGKNQLLAEFKAIQQRQARQGVVGVVSYPAAHCMYLRVLCGRGSFTMQDIQDFDQVPEGYNWFFSPRRTANYC